MIPTKAIAKKVLCSLESYPGNPLRYSNSESLIMIGWTPSRGPGSFCYILSEDSNHIFASNATVAVRSRFVVGTRIAVERFKFGVVESRFCSAPLCALVESLRATEAIYDTVPVMAYDACALWLYSRTLCDDRFTASDVIHSSTELQRLFHTLRFLVASVCYPDGK